MKSSDANPHCELNSRFEPNLCSSVSVGVHPWLNSADFQVIEKALLAAFTPESTGLVAAEG